MPISLPIFTIFNAYMPAYFNQNKCLNILALLMVFNSHKQYVPILMIILITIIILAITTIIVIIIRAWIYVH